MKGSNQKNPRCIALDGDIGERVHCKIYAQRPSTCREFGLDFINGQASTSPEDYERCTQARAHWNLPPIPVDTLQTQRKITKQALFQPAAPNRKG
jgi:Fe-S-cluster containining protein